MAKKASPDTDLMFQFYMPKLKSWENLILQGSQFYSIFYVLYNGMKAEIYKIKVAAKDVYIFILHEHVGFWLCHSFMEHSCPAKDIYMFIGASCVLEYIQYRE